jgi:3-oxoacyl-[acyl-carrier protein] reductase
MRKCALVTGGSRGIGQAVCVALAKDHGLHVLVNYASNRTAADNTVSTIVANGGSAEPICFDVADREAVNNAITQWETTNPDDRIEVLVNNAGITRDGLFMVMSPEDWDGVINTSLGGWYNVTHRLISKMVRNRYGRVISVVSVSGMMGNAGQANYSAAKAAVVGATKALGKELAKRKITVNAVAPGFIRTDMTKDFNEAEMAGMIPMNRFGEAHEVASAVSFLASNGASYITGEVININGGLYC